VAAQEDSMVGLMKEGMDFGWHQSGQLAEIDVSDFVVRVPRQFDKIVLHDLARISHQTPSQCRV
jgi:hypothetical protein